MSGTDCMTNGTNNNFKSMSNKTDYDATASKRQRFDSDSTNSSCGENQPTVDSRFEARIVPDIQVKKSILSGSSSSNQQNNLQGSQCASNKCSLGTSSPNTEKTGTGSILTTAQTVYSIFLSIQQDETDQYGGKVYRCFPEVQMTLEDDLTVESVIREILEKLNIKYCRDLAMRSKSQKAPSFVLDQFKQEYFELSEANKQGSPKGCSFDKNQILRLVHCKTRLALKVLEPAAFNHVLLKLLKKPHIKKLFDFSVHPIPEQDDDVNSVARAASHYKDSLIQREMDPAINHTNSGSNSHISQPGLNHQSSNSTSNYKSGSFASNFPKDLVKQELVPQTSSVCSTKKPSFWGRFFKCGVVCQ